jgi:arabinogalactan endo-1,4-beta-galactosidase
MKKIILLVFITFGFLYLQAQDFYFGADLSYVNEMEDCGAVYKENNVIKDPYQIFADHNCNLVRLRLWHSPNWYDNLNNGNRYSDLTDVKKSIQRAKDAGMQVLLDFHLSDTWADPGHQVVPAAWNNVVDDLPTLKDSLYNYIYITLDILNQENLLPEMVQVGNETNKGIILSQEVNDAGWSLDWTRNSELFNSAIQAIRDFETANSQSIQIAIHIADPDATNWYFENFVANGVIDFDIIGISYYHQYHGDVSIPQLGNQVASLKQTYGKEIMIFETGYPWTTAGDDSANNILGMSHPDYSPFSTTNQKEYLIQLARTIRDNGGKGMVYWEPAWVSTSCSTQWGNGSHYENATFFDFNNNLQLNGGIKWMSETIVSNSELPTPLDIDITLQDSHQLLEINFSESLSENNLLLQLFAADGRLVISKNLAAGQTSFRVILPHLVPGVYALNILNNNTVLWSEKLAIHQR